MATKVTFNPLTWVNKITKRSAENYNRMETGINDCATTVNAVIDELTTLNKNLRVSPFQTAEVATDSTTDWNTITAAGLYKRILGMANVNSPEAGNLFYCLNIKLSDLAFTQFAIPYSTGAINTSLYVRTYYNSTFSAWKNLTKKQATRYYTQTLNTTTLSVTTDSAANTHRVLYSLKIDNLASTDLITLNAQFEATNDLTYNVGIGRMLLATTSATATTGTVIVGGQPIMENITPAAHHTVFNVNTVDTGRTGTVYYNLVAYAAAESITAGDTVAIETGYGHIIATVNN